MTFVAQFNYVKKSVDSIFYSSPQIVEEIIALRHSLLSFKQVGCHCFLFIFLLPLYYVYELPYVRGIILHHDHYLTIIIQMPISQI